MKYYEAQFTITPLSQIAADILGALLADCGFEAFEDTPYGINAWVQQPQYSRQSVDGVISDFPLQGTHITYTVTPAAYEDWNTRWEEEGFSPIILTDSHDTDKNLVCIHDTRHADVPQARYDIIINPRQAFGTGSHQTTRMILRQLLGMNLTGKHVIDAGTGTGILSIMCSRLGAAGILAYDIDEWSVRNAQDNLRLNDIDNVRVCQGDSSILSRPADLIIANINLNILLADMPRFAPHVRPGGHMLLSGFYDTDTDTLIHNAAQHGFTPQARHVDEGWAMLLLHKKL
ncbi:MAG: 50S ribosomal protein L11 methyltransferase [Bacteroidaceae bacterium]|nr:50S ribosomal protein L11 methyltransferase [Bacteroidaceae bacterium]